MTKQSPATWRKGTSISDFSPKMKVQRITISGLGRVVGEVVAVVNGTVAVKWPLGEQVMYFAPDKLIYSTVK